MPTANRFAPSALTALATRNGLRIRAGRTHRFIGIWMVVVEGRLFVRSWSVTPGGWYRTLLKDRRGFIRLGARTVPVIAVPTRDARLRDAIDRAYLRKYSSPGSLKYARDLARPRSRATTTELRPLGRDSRPRASGSARTPPRAAVLPGHPTDRAGVTGGALGGRRPRS